MGATRRWSLLLTLSILAVLSGANSEPRRPIKPNHDLYNYYVVEHNPSISGRSLAEVANSLGVEVVEQVGELKDVWSVRALKTDVERSLDARDGGSNGADRVEDAYKALKSAASRRASDDLSVRSDQDLEARALFSSITHFEKQHLHTLEGRAPPPFRPPRPEDSGYVPPSTEEVIKEHSILDPYFPLQWHIVNDRYPTNTMNVTPVWSMGEKGYTGRGVITSLIDDGLDYTATDLAEKFEPDLSYDFNDHVPLPYPKGATQRHGTRCAGQIAASKNGVCGIGIAYDSRVAGLRILGGKITTVDQATALNFGYQKSSIYSCSWGPRDDGRHMQAPRYIVKKAFKNGVEKGRGGKGSVYVFASGNGGWSGDQCNFDGYTNSIYSVTVGSVDYKGLHPGYSEECTANMVVGYSSGSGEHIVTTDKGKNECALSHGGTSAAAPNVAAVFALALEARPDLNWRDIQHLVVATARHINPHDLTWSTSPSSKLTYSPRYGFGVLDASRYVEKALAWKSVPPQAWLNCGAIQVEGGAMDEEDEFDGGTYIGSQGASSTVTVTQKMCDDANLVCRRNALNGQGEDGREGMNGGAMGGIEHVTVRVWIDHSRRGDVKVELTAPSGMVSVLANPRKMDEAETGFPGWTFMSVAHWGEDPIGTWTLRVTDQQTESDLGALVGWNLFLWGSTIDPSKATTYTIDEKEKLLPPNRNDTITPVRPAIPSNKETDTTSAPLGTPTNVNPPHEPGTPSGSKDTSDVKPAPLPTDWVDKIAAKASQKTWIAGVIAFLILANIVGAVYFCCFRKRRESSTPAAVLLAGDNAGEYSALPPHDSEAGGIRMHERNSMATGAPAGGRYVDGEEGLETPSSLPPRDPVPTVPQGSLV